MPKFRFLLVLAIVLLSGCTTYRGVAEFAAYREALLQTRSASDAILDRLAVAERAIWPYCINFQNIKRQDISNSANATTQAACRRLRPGVTPFDPEHAAFIAMAGDPPGTAAFRRAMAAAGAYTEAMNALASGQTAEAVAGQVGQLVGIAAAASAAVVPPAATGAAVATLAGAISDINDKVGALTPPLTQAVGFVARAEFRDQLLKNGETINAALDGVREATTDMFRVFQVQSYLPLPAGTTDFGPTNKTIEEHRALLANWVIMLDASKLALSSAIAAAGDESGGVAGLLVAGQALTEAAQGARRALAGEAD